MPNSALVPPTLTVKQQPLKSPGSQAAINAVDGLSNPKEVGSHDTFTGAHNERFVVLPIFFESIHAGEYGCADGAGAGRSGEGRYHQGVLYPGQYCVECIGRNFGFM